MDDVMINNLKKAFLLIKKISSSHQIAIINKKKYGYHR